MAIDGNLDHDCGAHQLADIKQGMNTFDPAPVFNFLAQSIVKIVECLRHLSQTENFGFCITTSKPICSFKIQR